MKKYTHKSGHFIATATMYGEYEVVLLAPYGTDINRTIYTVPVQCRDLIENSFDWTEIVEAPVGRHYTWLEIAETLVTTENYVLHNSVGKKEPRYVLGSFVDIFLTFLPKK